MKRGVDAPDGGSEAGVMMASELKEDIARELSLTHTQGHRLVLWGNHFEASVMQQRKQHRVRFR
jgi:hypothetical protein